MKSLKYIALVFLILSCDWEDPDADLDIETDILSLSFENDTESIAADGNDRVRLISKLGPDVDVNQTVVFSTDQGSFAGTENAKTISVTTVAKEASATLISDRTVNDQITVTAAIGDFKVSKIIEFTRVSPSHIQLTADKLSLVANRTDRFNLTIEISLDGQGEPSKNTIVNLSQIVEDDNLQELALPSFVIIPENSLNVQIISKTDSTGIVQIVTTLDANGSVNNSIEVELIEN